MLSFSSIMVVLYVVFSFFTASMYFVLKDIEKDRDKPPKFLNVFLTTGFVMLYSFFIISVSAIFFSKKNTLPDTEEYDYVVVFGAGVSVDESKNLFINKRIEKAIDYANKHQKTKFVLSGAKLDDEIIEEAYYMRNYMELSGVDSKRILVDIFSFNTYENIDNSLLMIREDIIKRNRYENLLNRPIGKKIGNFDFEGIKIGFLSNDFHLMRINMMVSKKNVKDIYNIVVETPTVFIPYYYMREVLSLYKALWLSQLGVY